MQNESDLKMLQDLAQVVMDADTAFNNKQYDLAIKHYKAASDGYVQHFNQNNPERLQCLKQMAECYWQLQADQQAEALWSEVCGLLVTIDPFPAEKYVVAMFKLVKSLERQGKIPETHETYRLLASEADRLLNPQHPLQLSIRQSQASFLRHLDKPDEARVVEEQVTAYQKAATEKASEVTSSGTNQAAVAMNVKTLRAVPVDVSKSRKDRIGMSPKTLIAVLLLLIAVAAFGWAWTNHMITLPVKF